MEIKCRPDPQSSCSYCTNEVFDESELTNTTLSNMNQYWPTCLSGTNKAFWTHEWASLKKILYVYVTYVEIYIKSQILIGQFVCYYSRTRQILTVEFKHTPEHT